MKRIANKVLSCILALTMVVSMVPSQAFATDVEDEAETDSVLAGCFDVEFEAEDGTEQTEASDSGVYDDVAGEESAARNASLQSANFEFSSLSGRVIDSGGRGVSGVSVQIYNLNENVVLTACTTGSDGAWRSVEYDVIGGYTYTIRYYKTGYEFSENMPPRG